MASNCKHGCHSFSLPLLDPVVLD